ncbi:hypothetical protein [Kitasatospora sp. NPDC050543]|uniref:hypothetical protein n=1 Tax=Kitasatospora sp. NPDC050543 TaxID=3364054 RepID=UPI00378D4ECD
MVLGRHLNRDVPAFLAATGAFLDVDEYDYSPDADADAGADSDATGQAHRTVV